MIDSLAGFIGGYDSDSFMWLTGLLILFGAILTRLWLPLGFVLLVGCLMAYGYVDYITTKPGLPNWAHEWIPLMFAIAIIVTIFHTMLTVPVHKNPGNSDEEPSGKGQ